MNVPRLGILRRQAQCGTTPRPHYIQPRALLYILYSTSPCTSALSITASIKCKIGLMASGLHRSLMLLLHNTLVAFTEAQRFLWRPRHIMCCVALIQYGRAHLLPQYSLTSVDSWLHPNRVIIILIDYSDIAHRFAINAGHLQYFTDITLLVLSKQSYGRSSRMIFSAAMHSGYTKSHQLHVAQAYEITHPPPQSPFCFTAQEPMN